MADPDKHIVLSDAAFGARPGAPPEASFDLSFDDDDEEGGIDFRRYLAALLRYKWMIVGLGALGFAAGYGLSRTVEPVYAAQATIAIDVASRNAPTTPVRNAQLLESRAWLDLLRSFYVLDEVVQRRRLFITPARPADARHFADFSLGSDFQPGAYRVTGDGQGVTLATREGTVIQRAAIGDSLGTVVGFQWVAPQLRAGQVVDFFVSSPRDAAVRLNNELAAVLPPENAAFLRLGLRGADPAETAATLNAIVDRFVEVATVLKREKLTTNAQVLREQLASAFTDLRAAERRLESFRVNTITLPSERGSTGIAAGLAETRDPVRNAFFQLRIDRDALVRERDAILRALRSVSDSSSSLLVALGSVPAVAQSTELLASLTTLGEKRAEARSLGVSFSPSHAPLQRLLREIDELERVTIPEQANALVANLNQRIGDFDERIAASSREMQEIPTRAIEQTSLERDLEIAQNLYSQLRASYEQASLAERSASPDVRSLDRAVPATSPMTDRLYMIIAGGLAGGIGLGVVLALLLDMFDRRFRYPEQVTRELGLPILGALPLVRVPRNGRTSVEEQSQLTEALRAVRMNLTYAHGMAGTFITTVTSPGPGDGKSFVSANLARAFVRAGRRVLLIDGDTRRGRLHHVLNVPRRPGLLDFLAGDASRGDVIKRGANEQFDFIPCGTRSAGGPELLASSQMAQFVMSLRSEYDAILIDSPPLGAGVDPLVLAALSGSMVMVLRSGVTNRELAGSRLGEIHRLPIRVLGAILNDIKAEGAYRYYSYMPGYRATDEGEVYDAPPRRALLKRG